MSKNISKLISNLDHDISSEKMVVTSFTLSEEARYSMQWLRKAWGGKDEDYTRQKLFEKISENNVILNAASVIKNKKIYKHRNLKTIKQRINKKNLMIITAVSKSKNISRNELVSNTLELLYKNLSKTYDEDIKKIQEKKIQIEKIIKDFDRFQSGILSNKHLENSYYAKTNDVKNKLKILLKAINEDIDHYNINHIAYYDPSVNKPKVKSEFLTNMKLKHKKKNKKKK